MFSVRMTAIDGMEQISQRELKTGSRKVATTRFYKFVTSELARLRGTPTLFELVEEADEPRGYIGPAASVVWLAVVHADDKFVYRVRHGLVLAGTVAEISREGRPMAHLPGV